MYEYILSLVLVVLTFFILLWMTAPQRTMEHMVGRLATKFIANMLEEVRQNIIANGYEHLKFDLCQKEFSLPDFHLTVKNLLFTGASKFVINNVSYDVTTSRAIFDISIPKLFLAIGDVNSKAIVSAFGLELDAQVKGWISMLEPRITGAVVLEIDNEGKVVATAVDVNIELREIQSKIQLNLMETDYSEAANNFLKGKLPDLLNNYLNKCKGAIEAGLMSIANPILAQMF